MNSNPHDLDGVDLWFFGGTPGPDDLDDACTLMGHHAACIDDDDTKIPAFAHRCHCGKPLARQGQPTTTLQVLPREERASLTAFHA